MVTVGFAMNANLNSQHRLAVKSGGLPSMSWTKCYAALTANIAMWISLIENEGGVVNQCNYLSSPQPCRCTMMDLVWQESWVLMSLRKNIQ